MSPREFRSATDGAHPAPRLATVAAHAAGGRPSRRTVGARSTSRGPERAARRRREETDAQALRVLVADRHEATRTGLRLTLEAAGFEVCAECADATEAIARAARERPDVCVLDAQLPGGGLTAATAVARLEEAPRVVLLAAGDDASEFFTALRAGVRGYLLRVASCDALRECVERVAAGEAYVGAPFVTLMVEELRGSRHLAAGELSPREREVLGLLGRGLSTKEVALELGLAAATVRRHVSSALRKLGSRDRASALALLDVQRGTERG